MPRTQEAEGPTQAAAAQRYDSVLVHVEAGLASSRRSEIAARLARRFDARLIGLGAEMVEPLALTDPYSAQLVAETYVALREQVQADLDKAEEAFRRDGAGAESEWRRMETTPARALTATARAADLIVMGAQEPAPDNSYKRADIGDIVMSSGRPVLVAPAGAATLRAETVVIAWKDTREARRAVADALPFLVRAEEVVVMAVCAEDEVEALEVSASDVAATLRRRGIKARAVVTTAPDASVVDELNAEAVALGADLIVAGAYGHSRMAEWVFGGVTRGLLRDPQHFLLLSH